MRGDRLSTELLKSQKPMTSTDEINEFDQPRANDAEILEAISAQYGDRMESLTPSHKVGLLVKLAWELHGYAQPPGSLVEQVESLSQQGLLILMEAVIAQLKGELPGAIAPTEPEAIPVSCGVVQVIALYPIELYPALDAPIVADAENYGGELVGSGADGDSRDIVFEFPDISNHLSSSITGFMSQCLSRPDVEVLVRRLDRTSDNAASANEADPDSVGLVIASIAPSE